jgi:NADPH-dependent curcumin reductase CurA
MRNQAVILRSRPTGIVQAEHFAIEDVPVAAPEEGQIFVRNIFLSVEPAMRGWIADAGNYSDPVPIGSVMRALAVGHVTTSRSLRMHGLDSWRRYGEHSADRALSANIPTASGSAHKKAIAPFGNAPQLNESR